VLEVSLRKAGFSVTPAASVQDALDKLDLHAPDLIISETTFPDGDGFELRRRVRAAPDWSEIPFIFLTAEAAIENKIRGLELGVDDYLTKPIYIKEIVTRINILLQKRQRLRFEERKDGRTRFAGRVADMPVVDVIQTIEISRKSGVIQFVGEHGRQAAIYFRDGKVIDAEAGTLLAEDAVYRLLTWSEGDFEVVFRTVRRREVIQTSSQGLLMEGMRRLDEWSRLLEQLPPLTHRFEIDTPALAARLGEIPDDNNKILRLFDGKRNLLEVIDASDFGDLECLQAVSRLFFEDMLIDLDHEKPVRRITGKAVPLVEVEGPTPIEDAASGPIAMSEGHRRESARIQAPAMANTQPVMDSQLMSEESARVSAAEPEQDAEPGQEAKPEQDAEPGPLMGGYRPSSLRLIDDAIAAAQAIDPSLFEDGSPTDKMKAEPEFSAEENTTSGVRDASVPEAINDEPSPSAARAAKSSPSPAPRRPSPPPPPLGRDDSGLRMIGSLGRDRAEASGELKPIGMTPVPVAETQRELVTILPRRITREMQAVQPPPPDPPAVAPPPPAPPVEPPPTRPPPPRLDTGGSGVVSREQGPGAGGIALIAVAALLAGTAVFFWLRRGDNGPDRAALPDASAIVMTPIDAEPGLTPEAGPPPDDAKVAVAAVDARRTRIDAPIVLAPSDAGVDTNKRAKTLYLEAHDANQEGDFTKALELADASLALRATARGHIVRAQALQRLGRVEDALRSLVSAQKLAPRYATVYEVRGNILWAARRWDDAHDAYNQFLEIEQDSERADLIRSRLEEPH
jgi:CheY-like chemotaxis protein